MTIKPKVYLLGIEAKCLVNKTFDEIQQHHDWLEYTTSYTSYSFPIFVVYKTNVKGKRKRYVVVYIRKLNDLIILDIYLLPLQSNIIANVQRCINLAILNVTLFIYP